MKQVTINFEQDYDHVDYPFSEDHVQQFEHPILNWLIHKPFK